jgi:N-acetylglucosaminyl-diphospho-decaprenol L-rhamnosyltransferase
LASVETVGPWIKQVTFPKIAAVVINFKTPVLTLDCLSSLAGEIRGFPGSKAIVVDNASGDGSLVALRDAVKLRLWDDWVEIAESADNAGFSAGNNLGIDLGRRLGGFDGYWLTNSDTIIHQGALKALVATLQKDPKIGLVGPRLEWLSGELQPSCFRAISPTTELAGAAKTGALSRLVRGDLPISIHSDSGNGAQRATLDWISFACVLIRSEAISAIGPMDEGFFMYFEDVDYCRRANQAGWRIAYVPEARVVHLRGGVAPGEFSESERKRRPRFYYESRSRYLAKYYGRTGPVCANLLWTLGRGISLARELTGGKPPHTAAREAGDIWTGALCGFRDRPTDQGFNRA